LREATKPPRQPDNRDERAAARQSLRGCTALPSGPARLKNLPAATNAGKPVLRSFGQRRPPISFAAARGALRSRPRRSRRSSPTSPIPRPAGQRPVRRRDRPGANAEHQVGRSGAGETGFWQDHTAAQDPSGTRPRASPAGQKNHRATPSPRRLPRARVRPSRPADKNGQLRASGAKRRLQPCAFNRPASRPARFW